MMTLRQRVWIITSIVVALVIVIILSVLVFVQRAEENTDNTQNTQQVPTEITPETDGTDQDLSRVRPTTGSTPVFSSEPQPERLARQVAGIFVERFQSYSSTNNGENIDRVEDFVTPGMWRWVETQEPEQLSVYQGVTTEVIASRVLEISDSAATVEVDMQQEVSGIDGQEIVQATARVELVSDSNSGWLVNGFYLE